MVSKLLRSSTFAALCLGWLSGQFVLAQPQFIAPVPIKITNSAAFPVLGQFIAVADLNRDGRKDILTGFATLLANSDGSYTAIANGLNPNSDCGFGGTVADVDGDGRLDVVSVGGASPDAHGVPLVPAFLCVSLGNGDGTFRNLPSQAIGGIASLDLVADFNHDGMADLVIDSTPCAFANPDGCTTNPRTVTAGGVALPISPDDTTSRVLAAGDFRGDGYPDLVVQTDAGLQIFINHKGTSFTLGAIYPFRVGGFAIGDLNHDGKMDLVLAGLQPLASGQVPAATGQILLGNGDSTFRTGAAFGPPANQGVYSAFIGDVNGDGIPDIALQGRDLQVFPGKGDGTVGYPAVFNTHGFFADLNNNGKLDYLAEARMGFTVARNDGKGFVRAPRVTPVFLANSILTADFNKDGIDDVAVVKDALTKASNGEVYVLPGSGKGYFNPAKIYDIGMASGIVVAGDVNHDGIPDLVVARSASYLNKTNPFRGGTNTTDLSVLLGNADGTFKPAMNFTVLGAPAKGDSDNFAALADVNHDGKLDLIGDWGVALGNGDGTFAAPIPLPASLKNITAMAGGDFNQDGVFDLAVATTTVPTSAAHVATLLGDGKGAYTVNGLQQLANTSFILALTAADIDGDGKPDLIFGESYNPKNQGPDVDALVVRLGNGNGTFAPPVIHPIGQLFNRVHLSVLPQLLVADFNRDGKRDLLILGTVSEPGQRDDGDVALYLGIGGGKLSTTPQYLQLNLQHGVVLNLNGDSALDVAGTTISGVTRLINTGSRATVTK